MAFPAQANGSVIRVTLADGIVREYGSEIDCADLYQTEIPDWAAGGGQYNLSPTSSEQTALVQERINWWHSFDPENMAEIPADLLTASGSGFDPDISPEAAEYQVARIASARGISQSDVRSVIETCTTGRPFGLLGEPTVNVLKVNLTLDGLLG